MGEKVKQTTSDLKYKTIYMRNKDGSISKGYIDKLRKQYISIQKDKSKLQTFLNKEYKNAKESGVGLVFTSKGVAGYDLFISKERISYAKTAKKKISKFHNVNIGDVINRDNKLKKIDEKISKKKNLLKPKSVKRALIAKGIVSNYIFSYDDYTEDFMDNIITNIERAALAILPRHKDQRVSVRLSTKQNPFADANSFGVSIYRIMDIDEIKEMMMKKIEIAVARYDAEDAIELRFKTVGISVIAEPYGQILGAGGHRTISTAAKSWYVSSQTSRTNCFYRCICIHNRLLKLNKDEDLDKAHDELITDPQTFRNAITENSKTLKQRLKIKNTRATDDNDIQLFVDANYKPKSPNKCEVIIYNNVFEKIRTIRPTNWGGEKLKNTYEIQMINHHYISLVRWYNLNNLRTVLDEVIQIQTLKAKELEISNVDIEDENLLIDREPDWEIIDYDRVREFCKNEIWIKGERTSIDYEKQTASAKSKYEKWFVSRYGSNPEYCKRFIEPINHKIAAYDLEATPNGVEGGMFRSYRLSFAYNVLCPKGSIIRKKTITFGGKDCIKKWFDWLYTNRKLMGGYTLYAHNGGKFDVMLLLNDYILSDTSKWVLEESSLIVLNGAYLSFTLTSKEGDIDTIETVQHGQTSWTVKNNIKKKEAKGEEAIESDITFRDSMRLLPGGLKKLCEEFDVEHKKLSEVVNFDEVNINNCYGGEVNKNKPFSDEKFKIELCNLVYCNYDVLGLIEILNKFNQSVYDACNGIKITDCITGASLSKKHYFNTFYDKRNGGVYNLNKEFDEFCRSGYYGGRCEAFYIGERTTKLYYYDFTSLYPDVGRMFIPYGKPVRMDTEDIETWNERYKSNTEDGTNLQYQLKKAMVKVKVKTKDFDALPLHAIKSGQRLTFAHFEDWMEITMWYRELLYGISLDIYEYELVDGINFEGGQRAFVKTSYMNSQANKKGDKDKDRFWDEGILKDFFEDAVSKKAKAKKAGQPAMAQAYKIIANSGYGFWGLNADGDGEGRDGMRIMREDDDYFWELMASDVVSNIGKIGNYMMVRTAMRMPAKDFNVAIAASICSEARMKTYRFLKAVKDNNCNIIYCDTDSCICDLKLNDYPEMMDEFCWDGTGDDLGSMKNECLEKVEGYYKNKIMKELGEDTPKSILKPLLKEYVDKEVEKDGGELSFDKGIIAGCKQYSLQKTLIDGGSILASACKGVKRKLSYDEFKHLLYGNMMVKQLRDEEEIFKRNPEFKPAVGYRIYEQQTQFRSSTSDHIAEGSYTEIRKIDIDKSVRINYTKGVVENEGWVKPHILKCD